MLNICNNFGSANYNKLLYNSLDNMKGGKMEESIIDIKALVNVPIIYETERMYTLDIKVHAAFIIPFKSCWTWYMTEYDPEVDVAYGLVTGSKVEWGYFSLSELKRLGGKKIEQYNYPLTFRRLKKYELDNQLSRDEYINTFGREDYIAIELGDGNFVLYNQSYGKVDWLYESDTLVMIEEKIYRLYIPDKDILDKLFLNIERNNVIKYKLKNHTVDLKI